MALNRLRVALVSPDNRDEHRRFSIPGEQPSFGQSPDALVEGFRELPDLIELHIISCSHEPLPSPAKLADNIFFHSLVVPSWGWRSLYVGCVLAIRRCLQSIGPDLVHGHGTERYAALAAAFSGYPNVVTIRGNMRTVARKLDASWNSFHAWTARLEALALRKTNGVICNSSYTKEQVEHDAKNAWIIPNALRSCFFGPSHSARMSGGTPRLLNIGNVVSYKRQLELLSWAEELHQTGLRFTLDFIGTLRDEPYANEFLQAIAKAEPFGYARFLGQRNGDALIQELDTADALIHVPTEESFGLVAAEALARNLKLFASRTGGLVDIAAGVEGAELFDANDWDGLSATVTQWCNAGAPHPQEAARTMQNRYEPRVIAEANLMAYRSLLAT